MKTIKIFLASSEELTDDRNAFGNLVRRLDKIYEKRGIRIELFEWEDYDAAYNDRRKQDEYNEMVKASDMFLALFHTKAGKFTIEEFNVATEEFKKKASPKVYTYCKDLKEGEAEAPELTEFKERLFKEMGHYWNRYNNRDSMQLHFVMQLQLVETSGIVEKLKVEDGTVVLDGMSIAKIDNLQFAAGNEVYQKMSAELAILPEKIDKARQRIEKFPDDEELRDDLQQKLNYYNSLKDKFSQLQNALFETAQRIAAMQLEQVSDRLRCAIEAFEDGKIESANALLDEIAHEAEHHMAQLDQQRALVHQDIEVFQLQAKTIMADDTIPINERTERVLAIYGKADDWSEKSSFDQEKYEKLLNDYASFLKGQAKYDKAIVICQRLITLCEELYGIEHAHTAASYNNVGNVYDDKGNSSEALEYYLKALAIMEKILGTGHPHTAALYNNIGGIYNNQGHHSKALEYYFKSLAIYEKVLGIGHPDTAKSYNNIGAVYSNQSDYPVALEYYFKALSIREKLLGTEHPDTAGSYNNIGNVYYIQSDYPKALEYYLKALAIDEKVSGTKHPDTATSYSNIGNIYKNQGDNSKALEYYFKALSIREKVLGTEHPKTADSYSTIGNVYINQGKYAKALDYHIKAHAIYENVLIPKHPSTAMSFINIGNVYSRQDDNMKALEYYFKALYIYEEELGTEHPGTALSYRNIGALYAQQGNYPKALDFFSRHLLSMRKFLGLSIKPLCK